MTHAMPHVALPAVTERHAEWPLPRQHALRQKHIVQNNKHHWQIGFGQCQHLAPTLGLVLSVPPGLEEPHHTDSNSCGDAKHNEKATTAARVLPFLGGMSHPIFIYGNRCEARLHSNMGTFSTLELPRWLGIVWVIGDSTLWGMHCPYCFVYTHGYGFSTVRRKLGPVQC